MVGCKSLQLACQPLAWYHIVLSVLLVTNNLPRPSFSCEHLGTRLKLKLLFCSKVSSKQSSSPSYRLTMTVSCLLPARDLPLCLSLPPTDILAIHHLFIACIILGMFPKQRDFLARLLPLWDESMPFYPSVIAE